MLIKYAKDKKFRQQFIQSELKYKILKFILIRLLNYPKSLKVKQKFLYLKIQKLIKALSSLKSKVKIQKRCILTNRSRGVLQAYSISRIKFLELCRFGIIPGYKKAVW
jgi:ribosomal protein S14